MQRRLVIVCISVAIVAFCLCSVVYWHTLKSGPHILSRPSTEQTARDSESPNIAGVNGDVTITTGVPGSNGKTDKSDKYLRK
jgi:hypothetical protein